MNVYTCAIFAKKESTTRLKRRAPRSMWILEHRIFFPQLLLSFYKIRKNRRRNEGFEFLFFFRFVSFGRPVWKKTFVRKLKETGEAGKRHENTSSRIKVFSFLFFFFFFNPYPASALSPITRNFKRVFPRDGSLVFLFSTQLLKISYSSTKCVADFASPLLPPPLPPSTSLLFQQRSHYSPSRQFLPLLSPPLNDPL